MLRKNDNLMANGFSGFSIGELKKIAKGDEKTLSRSAST